ncbi:MAG: outer membrane beta-barrel protein [Pyrinomonadaceae bacterium]
MKQQTRLLALGTLFVFFSLHQQAQAQAEDVPRFEIGAQFSSLTIREPSFGNVRTEPGFGGRATFNFTDYLAAEAQVDFYPNDSRRESVSSGGRTTTGLFGVKAGKRFERFGVFGKVRPGFVHFARTISGFSVDPNSLPSQFPFIVREFRARTEFAIDIGGVLEFYPTRRIVTRFDIGDTIIRYKERTIMFPTFAPGPPPITGVVFSTRPSETKHSFQFSAGIGFRF